MTLAMLNKVEVEKYITCETTYQFYEELNRGILKGLLDHGLIFSVYHEAYATVLSYRDNPMLAIDVVKSKLNEYDEVDRFLVYKVLAAKLKRDTSDVFLLRHEGIKLCITLIEREMNTIFPPKEEEEVEGEEEIEFSWRDTKAHLEALPSDNERIAYLIDQMALYQQEVIANGEPTDGYYEKCKAERERIEQQQELKKMQVSYEGDIILSKQRGKKIDFIRTINALYELRFFEDVNGQIPTKEKVMKCLGKILGVDLTGYDSDLSQALNNGTTEKNVTIFQKMADATINMVTKKLSS
ncbi:hypothetical protein [Chitinophaga varians]|uniref:hypothetical protein n=1 Tax=Chitinophaga varians TaxID=2202339 RepID=UPI00165FF4CB|nr:hypothetical protein [Chitinophaga varians]MBC9912767.1 hypothetical protein [Chitinophaga varians]